MLQPLYWSGPAGRATGGTATGAAAEGEGGGGQGESQVETELGCTVMCIVDFRERTIFQKGLKFAKLEIFHNYVSLKNLKIFHYLGFKGFFAKEQFYEKS